MSIVLHLRPFAMAVAGIAAATAASGQTVLSRAAIVRGGIEVATLHRVRVARSLPALGVVLDPAPLLRLSGKIAAAEAAVAAAEARVGLAQKLAARSSQLYRGRLNSALDDERMQAELGTARIALAAARATGQSLLAQTEATWGPVVTAMLRDGGGPLPLIAAGKIMLIGLSLPPGRTIAAPPPAAEAQAAGTRFALQLVGPVPKMLGAYPGQSLVYRAAAQPGVPIGATVTASLPAGPERIGVVVPWSAVLWQHGRAMVFRAAAGNRFERVPIATDFPTAGGYLVSQRLSRGNRIIVRGAAALLGAGSQKSPRDDGDED
jgi:hypothetical protein